MVRASRPTSSSVLGSGTRRWIVDPVIAAASARMASTGLSARPVSHHVSPARSAMSTGTPNTSTLVMLSTVLSTSCSEFSATSVIVPCAVSTCRWARTCGLSAGSRCGRPFAPGSAT